MTGKIWNRDLKHWHEAPREPESFSEADELAPLLA